MNFLQQPIEKKMSRLIGGQVRFEGLKVSPFAGRVEAGGMIIAQASGVDPLLIVRRISAEASMARALAGEISVKSMSIEGAVVTLIRGLDGRLNIPRKSEDAARALGADAHPASADANTGGKASDDKAFSFEAQLVRVSGSQLTFTNRFDGYKLVALNIEGEMREQNGRVEFTFTIGAIQRVDVPEQLGSLKIRGVINGPLAKAADSAGELSLEFSDGLKATIRSTSFSARQAACDFGGPVDLAKIMALLPPSITLPTYVAALKDTGSAEVSGKLDANPRDGIIIKELNFSAKNCRIPRT